MRASALPMAAKCRGSAMMGSESEGGPRQSNVFAQMGSAFHELAHCKIMGIPMDMASLAVKYGITQEDVAELQRHLKKINLNIPAGFEISMERYIEHPEYNLKGTPDFDAVSRETKHMIVMDWKSGWMDVDPPESNWQIIAYIILLLTLYPEIETIEAHIVQPRFNQVKSFTFTRAFIAQLEVDMRTIISEAEAKNAPLTTGPWCHGCFKAMKCHAFAGAVVKITKLIFPEVVPMDGQSSEMTDVRAKLAQALPFVKAFERVAKQVESLAKAYVDIHGPLELGAGMIYGKQVEMRNEIDGEIAFPLLRSTFPDTLDSELRITKTSLEKLANKTRERGFYGKLMNKLEEAGALKDKPTQKYTFIKKGESLI